MAIRQIIETYYLMNVATEFGMELKEQGITQDNISQHPAIKKQFESIYDKGQRMKKDYKTLELLLGSVAAFLKQPIRFISAQRYVKNQVAPCCRLE